MTTEQRLSGFLVRLADEPDRLDEYTKDRGAVMDGHGVDPKDRDVVITGDLRKIRARIAEEHPDIEFLGVVMEPRPEPEPDEPEPDEPEPEEPEPGRP